MDKDIQTAIEALGKRIETKIDASTARLESSVERVEKAVHYLAETLLEDDDIKRLKSGEPAPNVLPPGLRRAAKGASE